MDKCKSETMAILVKSDIDKSRKLNISEFEDYDLSKTYSQSGLGLKYQYTGKESSYRYTSEKTEKVILRLDAKNFKPNKIVLEGFPEAEYKLSINGIYVLTSKKPEFTIKKKQSKMLDLLIDMYGGQYLDLNKIDCLTVCINKIDLRILNSFKTVKYIDQANRLKTEKIRGSGNTILMNGFCPFMIIDSKDIDKIKKIYLKKNGKLILGQKIQQNKYLKRIVLVFDLGIDSFKNLNGDYYMYNQINETYDLIKKNIGLEKIKCIDLTNTDNLVTYFEFDDDVDNIEVNISAATLVPGKKPEFKYFNKPTEKAFIQY